MKYLTLAFLIFILISPLPSVAAVNESSNELLQFFRPLQAQVIMPVEDGILINKGGAAHIAPGDIFASVTAEKTLINPQTGAPLDTLLEYGALFEVTRVKANLAYCKPLDGRPQPAAGASVRRFENIPIYFESNVENGFQLFRSLREQLPHLLWQDYLAGPQPVLNPQVPALVVHYSDRQLQVLDQNKRILFKMTDPNDTAVAIREVAPLPVVAAGVETIQNLPNSVVTAQNLQRIELPREKEIMALRLHDLDGNGSVEAILGFRDEIQIGGLIAGEFVEQTRQKLSGIERIFHISVIDLDHDGRPEIVIATIKNNAPYSVIYKYDGGKLSEVATSYLFLGEFYPEGASGILLDMGKDAFLRSNPEFHKVTLDGDQLSKTPFAIPGAGQIYGLTKITNAQGASLLVQLDSDDKLKVSTAKGETLWQSGDDYGGSTAAIRVIQPGSKNVDDEDKLFLKSTLKRTPDQTLLVAKHEGSQFFKNSPSYKNGQIVELHWNGFTLEQIGISENLVGRIADFDQADLDKDGKLELVAAVVYKTRGFFSKPVSGLVIFPNLKP